MSKHIISITWGRSCNYIPHSIEPICWDGSISLKNGTLTKAELLHINHIQWSQAVEVPEIIFDSSKITQHNNSKKDICWKSAVKPGAAYTLEGLRIHFEGDSQTAISLKFQHTQVTFQLGDLLQKERLSFHTGGKYSGSPINVFLGPDARPRLSKTRFLWQQYSEDRAGYLVTPDDFETAQTAYYHSLYGVKICPSETVSAQFPINNYFKATNKNCKIRLQLTAMLGYDDVFAEEEISFNVQIGCYSQKISHVFTNRLFLPKLEEIYIDIPWDLLYAENNHISVTHISGKYSLLLHRIAFGVELKSMLNRTKALPCLPDNPHFYVGTETDLLTPANGDVDALIELMKSEELGNFIMFRERVTWASTEDLARWAKKIKEYQFLASTSGATPEKERLFDTILGNRFLGEQAHEISNLIYGWGTPDPIEERKNRTLKECKESYLKRMGPHRLVGQALPQQHLDYEAGVEFVMTELPVSNASLVLNAARGSSNVFDKPFWGVHVANHVTRAPLDYEHVRRLFILLHQCWLHGASILQDEEVAYRYNHDTIYSYADELPEAFREIYQDIYHYANNISLGKPLVSTGFLQGNYDLLVGGPQARHDTPRSKVWGKFGPETDCWEFDTPESGWKMLDPYMPGIWLYPVLQDRSKIRLFFTGSPNGQVDLIPITSPVEKLLQYPVLVLPGWNTMTHEIYNNLCEYADQGGHLVLCAAQCTEHITRDFLKDKEDFAFINNGDLTALAGVQVSMSNTVIDAVCFEDETVSVNPGVKILETTLCGATVLATDRVGKPVVVEKKHNNGRVWLLCVGEYWGAEALDILRQSLCKRIVRENKQPVWITGDTNDVDYYVFAQDDQQRIVLLNTDWTSAQNKKYVSVNTSTLRMETSIMEGRVKHILVKDGIALSFEVPSSIIEDIAVDECHLSFTLSGVGIVTVELFTDSSVQILCNNEGNRNKILRIDMGDTWSERKIVIPLKKTN